ncbi:uncharacterized protein BJX67DRAFT_379848 [Aspergillus lucknowensis]|uniref:Uncharacterized protein n=1 Tax=Aspergillus lucknowensis TaxID=176173 RepID=A0ABR4LWJ2_9EURO
MMSTSFMTILSLLALTGTSLGAPATSPADLLQKRFDLTCQDNGGGYRPVGEAQNCVDYLFNKGDQNCVVTGDNTDFCHAGDTVITGSNIGPGGDSSLCRDVAYGAQKIIDSCTTPEGYVAGANAAGGNGNLIVAINFG